MMGDMDEDVRGILQEIVQTKGARISPKERSNDLAKCRGHHQPMLLECGETNSLQLHPRQSIWPSGFGALDIGMAVVVVICGSSSGTFGFNLDLVMWTLSKSIQ